MLVPVLIIIVFAEAAFLAVNHLRARQGQKKREALLNEISLKNSAEDCEVTKDPAISALCDAMSQFKNVLNEINEDLATSERASTRLSRNIQKALIYSSQISAHSTANHDTARRLKEDVTEGSSAVEEINATIDSLGKQVMQQFNAVETTSEAMSEIDKALQNVFSIATEGQTNTDALVQVTKVGKDKLNETDRVIQNVTEKVQDVSNLIGVINSIASKTNLLAMNAAIEAAHAGEAGRGFAVVAEEIRNLATSTSDNSKTISATLGDLVDQINEAAATSRSSEEAFAQIDVGVRQVTDSLEEINRLTSEISDRSGKVVESATELKSISGNTAESMEEMTVGAREIGKILTSSLDIAENLDTSMDDLTDKARQINLISTKISSSYLNVNKSLDNLGTSIQKHGSDDAAKVQSKLGISGIILAHINWVATSRAVMDGTIDSNEVNLVDSHQCDLGKWLDGLRPEDIADNTKMENLKASHGELHDCVRVLFKQVESEDRNGADQSYRRLLDLSAKIVQILTTIGYDDFISWDPTLSVGISTFDEHHQKLISLINKLYVNMESGAGEEVLKNTLGDLIDYTDWHFAAEERAFNEYGYPDREAHIQQHNKLLSKAKELHGGFAAGQSVLTNEVLDFLQDWVTNHILKIDRNYSAFLKGKVT